MVTNILYFVKCFDAIVFFLFFFCVYREGNIPSYLLAQWATFVNWVGSIPISKVPFLVSEDVETGDLRPSVLLYSVSHK